MSSVDFASLLQQAKTVSFDALPADDYTVQIQSSEAVKTGNQKDMIKVTGVVVGGPYNGKKVFNNFVISPDSDAALAIFFRHMNALGIDEATILSCSGEGGMSRLASLLQNRTSVWTLGIRDWQGQTRNEVKGIKAAGAVLAVGAPAAPAGLPAMPQVPGIAATPLPGLPGIPGLPTPPSQAPTPAAANGLPPAPPALPGMPVAAAPTPAPAPPVTPQPTPAPAPQVLAQNVPAPTPTALAPIATPPPGYEAYAAQWPTFTIEQQHQVYQHAGVPVPAAAPATMPPPPALPF